VLLGLGACQIGLSGKNIEKKGLIKLGIPWRLDVTHTIIQPER